jgi:hypothetical protein
MEGELPLQVVFGVGIDIDAEVFPAAHLHCLGVANCWIVIQIK